MHKFAKGLVLALVLFAPTVVSIPEVQAQNTPVESAVISEDTTPIPKKIYTENRNTRRTKKILTRADIRKIERKQKRKQIRRQQRRQARKDALQNFGKR
ncbi:MAG: hypothetical protein KME23_12260 [Goleter apudmare HA4340-LM2]|jgi:hypothetical protein|nr:hypothetical protein [Goleter apudmare HA4340-LM2]